MTANKAPESTAAQEQQKLMNSVLIEILKATEEFFKGTTSLKFISDSGGGFECRINRKKESDK